MLVEYISLIPTSQDINVYDIDTESFLYHGPVLASIISDCLYDNYTVHAIYTIYSHQKGNENMKLSKLIQHLPDRQNINIYDNIDLAITGLYIFKGQVKKFDHSSFLADREVLAFYTQSKTNTIYIKVEEDDYENC